MFSWLSSETNILKSGLLKGMTDVHAHLLPGVDDGMASVEESLAAIEYLYEIGVRRIFLTPHIMEDIIENHPDFLQKRFVKRINLLLSSGWPASICWTQDLRNRRKRDC